MTNHYQQDRWWNNPAIRANIFQVLILSVIISGAWSLFSNTLDNLDQRGISSGFDFLKRTAGFTINDTLIPFDSGDSNGKAFLVGLANTLFVSVLGIILATFLGVFIGVSRLSKNWIISKLATAYIEIFRNIPLLLQILFWYFSVLGSLPSVKEAMKNGFFNDLVFFHQRGLNFPKPILETPFLFVILAFVAAVVYSFIIRKKAIKKQQITGKQTPILLKSLSAIIGFPIVVFLLLGSPIAFDNPEAGRFNIKGGATLYPEFMALLFALTIYTAAFIAENVRSGIQAVSHGQTEAAHSLGIKPSLTLRLIIIPQALRVIIPPLASQYLNLAKNSSLAAAIAYPELVSVFAGTVLNNTGQALECVAITMISYLTISLSIAAFMNWYNKKMALVER